MNDTFNLSRFGLLFKKTVLERPVQLLGLMALILLITLAVFSLNVYWGDWNGAHIQSLVWGFVGGGTILASMIFSYFNTNASGAAYLMLPASSFEKWLCGIMISGVLFTCLFLAFYRLVDVCFVSAYHNKLDKNAANYDTLYNTVQVFGFNNRPTKIIFAMFANYAGAALIGSLYYNKAGLVKTALTVLGFLAFILLFNYLISQLFFSNVSSANPFRGVNLKIDNGYRTVTSPSYIANIADNAMYYIIPAVLWLTAYIRLKEKEI